MDPVEALPTWSLARRLRIAAIAVLLVAVAAWARTAGREALSVAHVQQVVAGLGAWAYLAWALLFVGGVLCYVPGTVFALAGGVAFGGLRAAPSIYLVGLLAVQLAFHANRLLGGAPPARLPDRYPWKLARGIERRPVRTVALLRLLMLWSPPLNVVLALLPLRARVHLLGSALGLVLPAVACSLVGDWLVSVAP